MRCVVMVALFLLIWFLGSCATLKRAEETPAIPPLLAATFEKAGPNRDELVKLLAHYRSPADSLQLRAATYLIENMGEQCYVRYALVDSTGTAIDFDPLDYPDYDSMTAHLDSLEARLGPLDFERSERIDDVDVVRADQLIANIDLAFAAWEQKPWASHLGFDDFCEFVLPYRGSNEPIESWRGYFMERAADLPNRMDDSDDPVEAARLINEDLKGWFTFDPRYYCHPTDQGMSEMLESGMGRCEDMTNLAIYAMRANGLAVTSDYTPYWADAGNNHAWNAILDADGKAVMFMGCEAHPGEYRLGNRMAKVYRKTFSRQHDCLAEIKPESEQVPRWLAGRSYKDVTADYVAVSSVRLTLTTAPPDTIHFAYLSVFNDGEWRAIDWATIDGETVEFRDVGRNIVYLPAYLLAGDLVPAGEAFLLHTDGSVEPLIPDREEPISMRLVSTTKMAIVESSEGIEESGLDPGTRYRLEYWIDSWHLVGEGTAGGGSMLFEQVPSGGLYWLRALDSRNDERIFTYSNGRQVWY